MPVFQFKAVNAAGEVSQGQLEAASREAAVQRLQAQGHVPIRVEAAAEGAATAAPPRPRAARGRRLKRDDLGVFTLELHTLLDAGLPLDRALELVATLSESGALRDVVTRVHAAVRGGADLSEAMAEEPRLFSPFYVNMVRAGEAGGELHAALARLSEFLERSRALRESVVSALLYPCILLGVAVISLAIIMGVVIPRFSEMFADAGAALPWHTQFLVDAGAFLQQWWWALAAGAVTLVLGLRRLLEEPGVRLQVDGWLLRSPVLGDLVARLEAARFTRTLGTLVANGVPLLDAITISRQIIGNRVVLAAMDRVVDSVRAGEGLAKPLLHADVFPRLAGHLMKVGEETGNLESMLLRLAQIYDREVSTSLRRVVALAEPALIIGLGVLIAGVVLSIVVAIFSINELAF